MSFLAAYAAATLATFVCELRWGWRDAVAFALVWPAWLAMLLHECVDSL